VIVRAEEIQDYIVLLKKYLMKKQKIDRLRKLYYGTLVEGIIPFWLKNSLDHEFGGYLHYLDRDGSVFNTDKGMWLQCRETWLFSKLYNVLEARKEWLDAAKLGYDFVMKHGFDKDGRMFFEVTRDGRPLRKRRYLFSETFGVMALTEYFKATGDQQVLQRAKDIYRLIIRLYRNPDNTTPPKIIPETRVTKSLSMRMMLICISQEIQAVDSDPLYKEVADDSLCQILNHFRKSEKHALLENVGPNGEFLDSSEGRCVNPGHSIEVAWFMMHEGMRRNDSRLIDDALEILDWSLELGWDKKYGGILYFVDIENKPPLQLEWDMKLWWPHTEALYATLLAYHLTGKNKYLNSYERIHKWTFKHFPDPRYGEWFAYLHRDGTLASGIKGSLWKGPFHLSRVLLQLMQLLDKMRESS